jgi:hypothetical protein
MVGEGPPSLSGTGAGSSRLGPGSSRFAFRFRDDSRFVVALFNSGRTFVRNRGIIADMKLKAALLASVLALATVPP